MSIIESKNKNRIIYCTYAIQNSSKKETSYYIKMADKDLTEDQVADLKEAFAMFDINGDGKFSFAALLCLSENRNKN